MQKKLKAGQTVELELEEARHLFALILAEVETTEGAAKEPLKSIVKEFTKADAETQARTRARGRHGKGDGRGAPPAVPVARPGDVSRRRRARRRALRKLVRDLPALDERRRKPPRHLRRRDRQDAAHPRDGFRRAVLPADQPDRHREPQGQEQHADRAAGRRRQPVCDRRQGRRSYGGASGTRHARRLQADAGGRARAWPGNRARLRGAVLAGSSVAEGASDVVRVASRRHAALRRESAEEVSGHRESGLLCEGREAGVVGRIARRVPVLDRAGRADFPRRQPAYEAVPVLGMGDRRRALASSGCDVSWRKRSRGRA